VVAARGDAAVFHPPNADSSSGSALSIVTSPTTTSVAFAGWNDAS
jgi:hypothetical protein